MEKIRVVVIEDNVKYAETISKALSESGYEVLTVFSRRDLDKVSGFAPQVWLLDDELSGWGIDGAEVAFEWNADATKSISITAMNMTPFYCEWHWRGKALLFDPWSGKERPDFKKHIQELLEAVKQVTSKI